MTDHILVIGEPMTRTGAMTGHILALRKLLVKLTFAYICLVNVSKKTLTSK